MGRLPFRAQQDPGARRVTLYIYLECVRSPVLKNRDSGPRPE